MKAIKLIILIIFILQSSNACSSLSHHQNSNLNKAVIKISEAIKVCDKYSSLVPAPEIKTLEKMNSIKNEYLISYIRYRHHINYESCLVSNGSVPMDYFVALIYDENTDPYSQRKAEELIKLSINSYLIDDVNTLNSLSRKDLHLLEDIDYLDKNFEISKVSEALRKYREAN